VLFVTSVRAVRAVWQTCRTAQKALEALPFEVVVKDVRHAPRLAVAPRRPRPPPAATGDGRVTPRARHATGDAPVACSSASRLLTACNHVRSMSKEVLAELRLLLCGDPAGALPLPQLFVGAQLVAGPEALEQLVAAAAGGALADALRGAGAMARLGETSASKCAECGGQGFVICPACRGSRKVRGAACAVLVCWRC
jgi:hypothetical protein